AQGRQARLQVHGRRPCQARHEGHSDRYLTGGIHSELLRVDLICKPTTRRSSMIRLTVSAFLATAVAAAVFLVPAWGSSAGLVGEVGPGFSIEVKKAGKDLKTIKAGTYRIKVEDKGVIH